LIVDCWDVGKTAECEVESCAKKKEKVEIQQTWGRGGDFNVVKG
jgi:hypothetical protein